MKQCTVWIVSAALLCAQQSREHFEVASVRPSAPRTSADILMGDRRGGPGTQSPERVSWRAVPLGGLITQAYGIKRLQLVGPKWLSESNATTFDVNATMPPGTTSPRMLAMLQSLLQERFELKAHREMQEREVYVLTIAKSGPKLMPAARPRVESPIGLIGLGARPYQGGTMVQGDAAKVSELAIMLEIAAFRSEALIVDETGLSEFYDFKIAFAPASNLGVDASPLPTIFTALEQDLGLKLEKRRTQVEVIVVDSVNRMPSEN